MLTRLFSGVTAKVAALGIPAKALVGVSVAAASVAGVGVGTSLSSALTEVAARPAATAPAGAISHAAGADAAVETQSSISTGTIGTSAATQFSVTPTTGAHTTGTAHAALSPATPGLPVLPHPSLAQLPAVTLPASVPPCLTSLIATIRANPTTVPTTLVSELTSCISSIVPASSGSSSFDLSKCVAAVTSHDTSAVLSSCVPFDLSKCVASLTGLAGTISAHPTSIPTVDVSACIPSAGSFGSFTGTGGFTLPAGWSGFTAGLQAFSQHH